MSNIISKAKDAIQHGTWRRWLHSLDDEGLQEVHNNFVQWRDEPEGDFRLSHDELSKRISIIETVMATRV